MYHLFSPHVDDDKPEEEEKGSFLNRYSQHKIKIEPINLLNTHLVLLWIILTLKLLSYLSSVVASYGIYSNDT